jgi:hypothetical protein
LLSLDQCYFMVLFFFISGLFTPSSFDRKGRREFIRDKCKRLGLPFSVYFWIAGPLLIFVIIKGFLGQPCPYVPNAGPPWFICWLLLFNLAYAAIGGDALVLPRPAFPTLLAAGMLLGVVNGLLMVWVPGGQFVMMPLVQGSLPLDIAGFAAGVLAKRGGWLQSGFPRHEVRAAFVVILVCSTMAILLTGYTVLTFTPKRRLEATATAGYGVALFPGAIYGALCVAIIFVGPTPATNK